MSETEALKQIHKALIGFDKRAERSTEEMLVATFVDSAPLLDLLSTKNNQVIHGRRGTGKTHALKFLAEKVIIANELPIYIDLRSAGSNGSIYNDASRSLSERAATLIIDVLGALRDELFRVAVQQIDSAPNPEEITIRVDDFARAISEVKIGGSVERVTTEAETNNAKQGLDIVLNPAKQSLGFRASKEHHTNNETSVTKHGEESIRLDFGSILSSLKGLLDVLGSQRVWLLIDEWSEIPIDLQPYLADLIRRTILPVAKITIKIAAIEHRSNFTILKDRGEYVGIELGADVAADLNLDDFLVFDSNQEKATEFFSNLIFKHFASSREKGHLEDIDSPEKLVQTAFTQWPVFEEFVRAVEGVPRDALNLASKMAAKSFGTKISVQTVRSAARDWYQQDKASVVRGNQELSELLEHIIDEVLEIEKLGHSYFQATIGTNG